MRVFGVVAGGGIAYILFIFVTLQMLGSSLVSSVRQVFDVFLRVKTSNQLSVRTNRRRGGGIYPA
eukprot:187066-Pyramimonas_sp.AAC.1